ncbi:GNAT family N-acetyltransferase [Acerihabitans sp. KWT182]|uniref:GNAT family N-acetyltransferase n=1 Tax=Acerihabitans sp. KWT182 TaxID=3157919 RepID=A0AAU7Q822_9GAMM
MELIISDIPDQAVEKQVLDGLWGYNHVFSPVDIHPFRIVMKDSSKKLQGGIIARTWWGGLEIQYLWIAEIFRGKGFGRTLMAITEGEAIKRDCHFAYVDTLSFHALGFYKNLGYSEYGSLSGFAHTFSRHYLVKQFRQ